MNRAINSTVSSTQIRNRLLLIRNEIECQNEHYGGLAMSKTKTALCPHESSKAQSLESKGDSSFDDKDSERKKSGEIFQNTEFVCKESSNSNVCIESKNYFHSISPVATPIKIFLTIPTS